MTHCVYVSVSGVPRPQGSKQIVRGRLIESSRHVAQWRAAIARGATDALPEGYVLHEGPVRVSLSFRMPRPKSHMGAQGVRPSAPASHLSRPDVDKLTRAALDALTGVVFRDDSQVVLLTADKGYADGEPGVEIGVVCL